MDSQLISLMETEKARKDHHLKMSIQCDEVSLMVSNYITIANREGFSDEDLDKVVRLRNELVAEMARLRDKYVNPLICKV